MLLVNPAPPTRAQDFRDQGTYVIPDGSPFVAVSYPDTTQAVVDGIVTNAFMQQHGASASSTTGPPTPSWTRKACGRPKRRRRASSDRSVPAATALAAPASVAGPLSPISGVPWWLLGVGAFLLLVGLPKGRGR